MQSIPVYVREIYLVNNIPVSEQTFNRTLCLLHKIVRKVERKFEKAKREDASYREHPKSIFDIRVEGGVTICKVYIPFDEYEWVIFYKVRRRLSSPKVEVDASDVRVIWEVINELLVNAREVSKRALHFLGEEWLGPPPVPTEVVRIIWDECHRLGKALEKLWRGWSLEKRTVKPRERPVGEMLLVEERKFTVCAVGRDPKSIACMDITEEEFEALRQQYLDTTVKTEVYYSLNLNEKKVVKIVEKCITLPLHTLIRHALNK